MSNFKQNDIISVDWGKNVNGNKFSPDFTSAMWARVTVDRVNGELLFVKEFPMCAVRTDRCTLLSPAAPEL